MIGPVGDGIGLPLELLDNAPFEDFFMACSTVIIIRTPIEIVSLSHEGVGYFYYLSSIL
jgi:hypothetical protein